jgi:hypothetical protein
MKFWKKMIVAAVVLGLPGVVWASTSLASGGCCPFCP